VTTGTIQYRDRNGNEKSAEREKARQKGALPFGFLQKSTKYPIMI
jgi:hypothetical protein